jgi:hypothetical protein
VRTGCGYRQSQSGFRADFSALGAVTKLVKIHRVGDKSNKSLCGNGLAAGFENRLIDMVKPSRSATPATALFFSGGIRRIIGKFSRWR